MTVHSRILAIQQTIPRLTTATGYSAVTAILLTPVSVVTATKNGVVTTLPTGNFIRLYIGATQQTTSIVYGPATTTQNGLTCAVNTSTGAITLTHSNWTSTDQEVFIINAVYNGTTYSQQFTITKAKAGEDGGVGSTGSSARIAFTTTNSAIAPATPTAGSGDVVPTSPGTWSFNAVSSLSSGQYQYQSNGIFTPGGNIVWGAPYISNFKAGSLEAVSTETGTLNVTGTLTMGSTGAIRTGTTNFNAAGIFLGYDTGNYKFSIGDGNNNLSFNGATGILTIPAAKIVGVIPNAVTPPDNWNNANVDPAAIGAVKTDASNAPAGILNSNIGAANLVSLSWWKRSASIPWTLNAETNSIVAVAADGGDLVLPGPRGGSDLVWYCRETTGNSEEGGGWNNTTIPGLDPSRTYRFAVPIRRYTGSEGTAYWGSSNLCDLNTTNPVLYNNPYFCGNRLPQTDRWYLFVGFIFPYNSQGNTHSGSGIYDCKTGALFAGGTNFNFQASAAEVTHRAYQFYASLNAEQLFGRPMVNLVDGTEPSLREYLESTAVLNTALAPAIADAATKANWSNIAGQANAPANNATVGATWGSNIGGQPTNLAGINGTEGSKLTGIQDGATVGAQAGIDLRDSGGAVLADAAIKNSGISMSSTGVLNNGLGTAGQVLAQPVIEGRRKFNNAPSYYTPNGGTTGARWLEFKEISFLTNTENLDNSAVSAPGSGAPISGLSYCTLETIAQFGQATSAGQLIQYCYSGEKTFRRYSTDAAGTFWNAWVQDLDRNAYTGDLEATKGAPTNTYVGSTLAQNVESNANNGNNALSAINDSLTGLATKLKKSGDSITGRITLAVEDGIFAGSDTSNGVYMGMGGLVGKAGGITRFSIDTAGNATFGGTLTAANMVNTTHIVNNAAVVVHNYYYPYSTTISTTSTVYATLTIPAASDSNTILLVSASCAVQVGSAGGSSAGTVRIVGDMYDTLGSTIIPIGVICYELAGPGPSVFGSSAITLPDFTLPGNIFIPRTITFALRYVLSGGFLGATVNITYRNLTVIERKR